jgi:hypothetical protein
MISPCDCQKMVAAIIRLMASIFWHVPSRPDMNGDHFGIRLRPEKRVEKRPKRFSLIIS